MRTENWTQTDCDPAFHRAAGEDEGEQIFTMIDGSSAVS
jgi:hypothetical protein